MNQFQFSKIQFQLQPAAKMMSLLKISLFHPFTRTKTQIIKYGHLITRNIYLIQAPPQKPSFKSAQMMFVSQNLKNMTHADFDHAIKLSQKQWKLLPSPTKNQYKSKFKAINDSFKQAIKAYDAKYTQNLSPTTVMAQFTKDYSSKNQIKSESDESYFEAASKNLKKLSEAQKQIYIKKMQEINLEKQEKLQAYKFPVRHYDTQRQWSIVHKKLEEEPTEHFKQDMIDGFKVYNEEYEKLISEWLVKNDYKLTSQQFIELLNLNLAQKQQAIASNSSKMYLKNKEKKIQETKQQAQRFQDLLHSIDSKDE